MTEQQYDTERLNELAKRHLWMHFTRHASYATHEVPIMVRGEGCYVWDAHGNRYLDGLSGLFVVQAGHGRRDLAQAAAAQAETLEFFPVWSYAHPPAIELAAKLAERFHVVLPDLRGYGDSVGPTDGGPNHVNYSFRTMAQDQIDVMASLGYSNFFVAGHDRGARVAHRMALDHPEKVRKMALLDILPTRHVWNNTSRDWTLNSWHWSF